MNLVKVDNKFRMRCLKCGNEKKFNYYSKATHALYNKCGSTFDPIYEYNKK